MPHRLVVTTMLLGSLAAVGLWLGWVSLERRAPLPRAQAEVGVTTRDLGTVPAGQIRHVPFRIRNGGTRRLVVNELSAGCCHGGTRTLLIEAGKTAVITVPLDTMFPSGRVTAHIDLATNDPARPLIKLTATATAVNSVPGT